MAEKPAPPPERDLVAERVNEVVRTRRDHIEKMTAAWITENPGIPASEAEIVEVHGADSIRFLVRRREPIPAPAPPPERTLTREDQFTCRCAHGFPCEIAALREEVEEALNIASAVYVAVWREGWEPGATKNEAFDRLHAWLCDHDRDPNKGGPR